MIFPWGNRRREIDLDEEIQTHLQMAEQDCIHRGESPEQAKYTALREFGNLDMIKETTREMWWWSWLDRLMQDLQYALRQMRRSPGFSLAVVLTLALGIGANVAVFSVVNEVLLRPLPFPRSEELVKIKYWIGNAYLEYFFGPNAFQTFQSQSRTLSDIAAYSEDEANLSSTEGAERISFMRVSANFFPLLDVQPQIGRGFLKEEDQPGGNPAVILNDGFWKRHYAGDPGVIGQFLRMNGASYSVIGILPASFDFPDSNSRKIDIWMPLVAKGGDMDSRVRPMSLIGRIKPSVPIKDAHAELESIWKAANLLPGQDLRLQLTAWQEEMTAEARLPLLLFLGAFTFVLLIACVNVSNLWLARIVAREKEMAVRLAIGAKKVRIIRQIMTESLSIAVLGGLLGLGLAFCVRNILQYIVSENITRVTQIHMDIRVLLFTLMLCLVPSFIVVLAAASQTTRLHLMESLKEGRNSFIGPAFHRTRRILVIAQVGLAVMLLIGTGLLFKSLLILQRIDPGYQPKNVMGMMIDLAKDKYPASRSRAEFMERILDQIKNLPGVEAAALTLSLPTAGSGLLTYNLELKGSAKIVMDSKTLEIVSSVNPVSPAYFRIMGIPLIRGREFTNQDRGSSPKVAIVSRKFVSRYLQGQDPIGRQFRIDDAEDWITIIAVAGDIHNYDLTAEITPQIYMPYMQHRIQGSSALPAGLVVRYSGDPTVLAASARSILKKMDPDQTFYEMMPLDEQLSRSHNKRKANVILMGVSSALALVLAFVGIYGVVSYQVSRRTQEMGVRMALGAQPRNIVHLILKQSIASAIFGLLLGIGGAFALTRYISSMLYGVTTTDPLVFIAISSLVFIISIIAGYIPSRKTTKIRLAVALRNE